MQRKTIAIVLSQLKYKDHDLIVKCYTQHRGVVSYLVRGALRGNKGGSKSAYFLPLSQLQLEEQYKPNRALQTFTEVKLHYVYGTLHSHVLKSAIVMFLAEVLSACLKEEEQNQMLFGYIETAFQWLDQEQDCANFHLLFLLNLTKFLGFYPNNQLQDLPYFNLYSGQFDAVESRYTISGDNLEVLKHLLGINFDALNSIKLNAKQRQSFLNSLLMYFELHLGAFKKPKSLEVFNQIFH